jgi:transposase-like protein
MNKGQFRVPKRTQKDYTLAFKLQVVDEVEKGELSQDAAQRKYGIQGNATILVWLRKHGRLDWSANNTMAKKDPPNKKIRELEKKIKRIEEDKEILNTAIDIADEMLNTDIRKKYLSLLSKNMNQQQAQKDESSQLEE